VNIPDYGSKEWFVAQGEPEWRTTHNQNHVIGAVSDTAMTNEREPQITAGPQMHYATNLPAVNLQIDHRLARPKHSTDGSLGLSLSPLAMMNFAAELFHLAHAQYQEQLRLELYERLKP
jgi:hypothetical protein